MRTVLLVAGLLLLAAPAYAGPIDGEWLTQGGGSKVRIGACPGKADQICGTVSWLPAAKAQALDAKNPNVALKSRPILGVATVSGFKLAAPGKWTEGKLYDPASGRTYDGKISLNANGALKVEGCVMMVCQAQTWKRG